MQAEVRGINANDIRDWPNWVPMDASAELQWFTVSIGMDGTEGSDLFQVAVATRRGINARRSKTTFFGLIVDDFTPAQIEQAIRDHAASVHSTTWEEIARRLGPAMRWEYTDYK
jgi:hypothetical protein